MAATDLRKFEGFEVRNAQKPSKSRITLPTEIKPTFEMIDELEKKLANTRQSNFALERDLSNARRTIKELQLKLAQFLKDESSGK